MNISPRIVKFVFNAAFRGPASTRWYHFRHALVDPDRYGQFRVLGIEPTVALVHALLEYGEEHRLTIELESVSRGLLPDEVYNASSWPYNRLHWHKLAGPPRKDGATFGHFGPLCQYNLAVGCLHPEDAADTPTVLLEHTSVVLLLHPPNLLEDPQWRASWQSAPPLMSWVVSSGDDTYQASLWMRDHQDATSLFVLDCSPRCYVIYDSRALEDVDSATVMEVCSEADGEALEYAIAAAPDYGHCVVYSYADTGLDLLVDPKLEWVDPALRAPEEPAQ
jgi:hypothetical protein